MNAKNIDACINICVYIYIYTYKYIYMCVNIYIYICLYMCICVHMCIHTCIHTCILDLGSFVLDLICILSLDLRVFCFCSHFGHTAKQPCCLLVNGLLAALSILQHGCCQPADRHRCRTVQNEDGCGPEHYRHGPLHNLG